MNKTMASLIGKLPTRPLGKNGPQVPRLGLGLMSNSGIYGLARGDERLHFLDGAYSKGETFWDTGECRMATFSVTPVTG